MLKILITSYEWVLTHSAVVLTILGLIFTSGLIPLYIRYIFNRPKIRGRICIVVVGEMSDPKNQEEKLTSFLVYLYLTNLRKYNVHILDYEMEVSTGFCSKYEKLERIYNAHNVKNYSFLSETLVINLGDLSKKLINREKKPVAYGVPLQGFIMFGSKKRSTYFTSRIDKLKYKVTCIDIFGKKHKIRSAPKQFMNFYLLEELADIELRPRQ